MSIYFKKNSSTYAWTLRLVLLGVVVASYDASRGLSCLLLLTSIIARLSGSRRKLGLAEDGLALPHEGKDEE